MVYCNNCGNEIRDDQTFCGVCGNRRPSEPAKVCVECGREVIEGNAFCIFCGTPYEENVASTPVDFANDNFVEQQIQMQNQNTYVSQEQIIDPNIPNDEKKKSKKKVWIIAISITLAVILIAVGVYWFLISQKQGEIEDKYKEVSSVITTADIVLTTENQEILAATVNDMYSISWGVLDDTYDNISKLYDDVIVIQEGKTKLKEYISELEQVYINASAYGTLTIYEIDIEYCEIYIQQLEDAIYDNDVTAISEKIGEIRTALDDLNAALDADSEIVKDDALAKYNQYKGRYDSAVQMMEEESIDNNYIEGLRVEAEAILVEYKSAIDSEDWNSVASLEEDLDKFVDDFEDAVHDYDGGNQNVEFIIPYSDVEIITATYFDNEELTDAEILCLCVLAKNEIYARYGANFETEALQEYFDQKSWYSNQQKVAKDMYSQLNDIEKSNIDVLNELIDTYKQYVPGANGLASDYTYEDFANAVGRFYAN